LKPNSREITLEKKNKLLSDDITSITLDTTRRPFIIKEVRPTIENLNLKKTPGYDLITNQILQKMPEMETKYIIQLCNAVLRRSFFPPQWKAQIIMIQKFYNPAALAESCRPILLPVLSKLFEKLLFPRIFIIMESQELISDHQFGFRGRHATIKQIHRIVKRINNDMDGCRHYTAVSLAGI
jgi:hypothetical protein